jgi:hypothetical protein
MYHASFAYTFGPYSSKRRFIDGLYSLRSKLLHTGFIRHRLSALPMMGGDAGIRVASALQTAQAGIIEFLWQFRPMGPSSPSRPTETAS